MNETVKARAIEIMGEHPAQEWVIEDKSANMANLTGLDRWNACVEMAVNEIVAENEMLKKALDEAKKEIARLIAENEALKTKAEGGEEEKTEERIVQVGGTEYDLEKIGGEWCLKYNEVIYCNDRYHKPYLAKVEGGEFEWQDKKYTGYGKNRIAYYSVSELAVGDYIQMAGGSGGNKYPWKGQVTEIDREIGTITLYQMSDEEFSNV